MGAILEFDDSLWISSGMGLYGTVFCRRSDCMVYRRQGNGCTGMRNGGVAFDDSRRIWHMWKYSGGKRKICRHRTCCCYVNPAIYTGDRFDYRNYFILYREYPKKKETESAVGDKQSVEIRKELSCDNSFCIL